MLQCKCVERAVNELAIRFGIFELVELEDALWRAPLVGSLHESAHGFAAAAPARKHVEKHPVRHLKARDERLRGRGRKAIERRFVPSYVSLFGGLFTDDPLLLDRVAPRF